MIIKVILDDGSQDIIYSHILQFGIEYGLDGKKIKMFFRESENAWVPSDSILSRKTNRSGRHEGPERRSDVPLTSLFSYKPQNQSEAAPVNRPALFFFSAYLRMLSVKLLRAIIVASESRSIF